MLKSLQLIFIILISSVALSQEYVSPDSLSMVNDSNVVEIEVYNINDTLPPDLDSLINRLLYTANRYIGIRYRYGGNTPAGFDCSGFVSYIFTKYGYELPRSSKDQALLGVKLRRESVRPGDLLFYKGRNTNSSTVGHVALVVDTSGNRIRFIHASRHKGITYDFSDSDYYSRRFIGARRIFDKNYIDSLNISFTTPVNFDEIITELSDTVRDTTELVEEDGIEDIDIDTDNSISDGEIRTYIVKRGDTLYAIARQNRTSVEKIKSDNNLRSDKIFPGQRLIIKNT
ncbi:MAG: NlpC/P60 family protein [Bacteroidales bacterium]|nr:NlpC/P60 family protein [Bacteroidales bacterium]